MKLSEIKVSTKIFLTPADISEIYGANVNTIRRAAKNNPAELGFPVSICGTRIRIPRKPFLRWLGEGGGEQ